MKKKEKEREKEMDFDKLKSFIKRDMVYIIVCLMAIIACLYTIESVHEYQDHCNIHWTEQISKCNCGYNELLNWSDNYSIALPLQEIGIGVDDSIK